MRGPTPTDVLAHVTLVTGKEEFLSERTVVGVREAVRRHDSEAELSETLASGLTLAQLGELAAPSLFSATRCVVGRGLENLPEESVDGLLDYAASPADEVALVLVHGGGQKGSGLLTKLRKLAGVTEVKSEELRASEYPGFVAAEVRGHGGTIEPEAASALVRPSARTSAAWRPPPTSWSTTSPTRRSPRTRSSGTSGAGPRPSRS